MATILGAEYISWRAASTWAIVTRPLSLSINPTSSVARRQMSNARLASPDSAATYQQQHIKSTHVIYKVKVKASHTRQSTPSAGPGADPGVQAVSLQVTVSHPPGGRLPLLSARPAVTSPAAEHHRPLASTKLYCLVTEEHRCRQLA